MKTILGNQKGFGIIEALTAIVISGIAMLGLFVGSNYAKAKAVENYHYRVALLRASEVMENIRHHNRFNKQDPVIGSYNNSYVLDERNGDRLIARVTVKKEKDKDMLNEYIGPHTHYTTIIVTLNWEEAYKLRPSSNDGIERSIAIREDYFYNEKN